MQSITKHKWAHPFKRPVTEKEAPDYKDIVKSPMDLSTLRKRVEAVRGAAAAPRRGPSLHIQALHFALITLNFACSC